MQIETLRTINNLTLIFDGNTTRKLHSIYVILATTPLREIYFLGAHGESDERHTTQWVNGLRHKLEGFWHNEWPFNQLVKDGNSFAWWESLQDHPHGHVLAHLSIKIFSVLVNSMPDERTDTAINVQSVGVDDDPTPDVDADSDEEEEADDEPLESAMGEGQPAQAVDFEIDPDIDISSKALTYLYDFY
ncbi:uncharacterized protein EDB91DRAFT_1086908 [Suillus paluster]|uniref:uncharacterized protein n=1 Tax=Suillus paluster TaxID=48578 RepID=UPI001B85FABC|nr:uncharacterized protein EDB91DRAFT_1087681 [Suillus paluster]XP_041171225.1 uncharacterized protein EDB91DRAFT_1086908 [Suillus paluster]KAG1723843.1 hypothetical protein EDB91DRAFT_1087681 [Suillus paluster]KAG1726091.1 hypothetical protein EDB91DRAFT_1086908 [Suillus paluster]